MKRSKTAAAATRRQIVAMASKSFNKRGIADTGLADIMASAGMTHGGFYRHFNSKSHLVNEALAYGIDQLLETIRCACMSAPDETQLNAITAAYLSLHHRNHAETGCPFAALGSETARMDGTPKDLMTEGLQRLASMIEESIPDTGTDAKPKALSHMSMMVGAIMLSRMVSDPAFSAAILAAAAETLRSEYKVATAAFEQR